MQEIWKEIPDFPCYEIGSQGNVRSKPRTVFFYRMGIQTSRTLVGQEIKQFLSNSGYLRVQLVNKDLVKKHSVHRLVAKAFLTPDSSRPHVNHINGNRQDNRHENLEWSTPSENALHAYRSNGRVHPLKGKIGKLSKVAKPVVGKNHETGEEVNFHTARCAQRTGRFKACCITNCIAGRAKTHAGFVWEHEKPSVSAPSPEGLRDVLVLPCESAE